MGNEFALLEGAGAGFKAAGSGVWPFPRVPPRQMGPGLFVPGPQPQQGQMSPRGRGQGSRGRGRTSNARPPPPRRAPGGWGAAALRRGGGAAAEGLDLPEVLGSAADISLVSKPAPDCHL